MISVKLDWWHVALLALAVVGLVALAFGWTPGALVALLGLGASAGKARRDRKQPDATDAIPDRPEPDTSEPVTEYSEAADDVQGAVADQEVEEMTTDEIKQIIEEGL
jgi:hypothetical protein